MQLSRPILLLINTTDEFHTPELESIWNQLLSGPLITKTGSQTGTPLTALVEFVRYTVPKEELLVRTFRVSYHAVVC